LEYKAIISYQKINKYREKKYLLLFFNYFGNSHCLETLSPLLSLTNNRLCTTNTLFRKKQKTKKNLYNGKVLSIIDKEKAYK
jgi:hypothetical protein